MSKKAKYKAVRSNDPYNCTVESARDIICQHCTYSGARKIARALNAMEAKSKAKAFAFDWGGIDPKYKLAAMDSGGEWCCYESKPHKAGAYAWYPLAGFLGINRPPYPGDWRESLQERPTK